MVEKLYTINMTIVTRAIKVTRSLLFMQQIVTRNSQTKSNS